MLQVVVEGSVKRRASKVRHGTGGLCIATFATSELAVDVGASLGAKLADLAATDSAAQHVCERSVYAFTQGSHENCICVISMYLVFVAGCA